MRAGREGEEGEAARAGPGQPGAEPSSALPSNRRHATVQERPEWAMYSVHRLAA